jgi:hypothetical protein
MSNRVEMDTEGHAGYSVVFRHWLPTLLGADAATPGRTIYVAGDVLSPHLHAHEYAHSIQARRYGVPWFLVRYVGEMAWRVVQAAFTGSPRTILTRAHHRHSLERRAELFARLRYPDFAEVRAP